MDKVADPFYSPRTYIEWAKGSYNELNMLVEAFLNSEPYAFVTEQDPDGIHETLKFKLISPLPDTVTKLAVDVANYLRSALDQTMFVIRGKMSYFPFASNLERFETSAIKGRHKDTPPAIVAHLRAFMPYKGGNDLLWALNEMANTNKHGSICRPVSHFRGFSVPEAGFSLKDPVGGFNPVWDRSKNEVVLFQCKKGGNIDNTQLKMMSDITLDGIEIVDGQPVRAVLAELIRQVDVIVFILAAESKRLGIV